MRYLPKQPYVRPLGRVIEQNDTLYLGYGGSGLDFTFTGTRAAVTVATNFAEHPAGEGGYATYFGVYINGKESHRFSPQAATGDYLLFESDTPQTVTVLLCKLSEEHVSRVCITGVETDGEPAATAPKARRIEVVGDSLTCGYGIEHPADEPGGFQTKYENAYEAWGCTLARLLDADVSLCCRSGCGVYSDYSDGNTRSTWLLAKDLYESRMLQWNAALGLSLTRDDSYAPQAVVINLGTNDGSYTRRIPEREALFEDAYVEFLRQVRRHNPQAMIFGTIGACDRALYPRIAAAAKRLAAEGDENIRTFELDAFRPEDGTNQTGHPTLPTQKRMAEIAAREIRAVMGW